jgi:hypothetical protein
LIDTDYNAESFFVRHAHFLGAASTDPYKALKKALRAEIDEDAWASLNSDTSRPFPKPASGPHRRQGHQSSRRRGDEGVFRAVRGSDAEEPAIDEPLITPEAIAGNAGPGRRPD